MFLPSNITLKFGDSGDFVAELQRRLVIVQCFTDDAINGFYDGNTVNAVSRFQGMSGLNTDGVAGPETLRRLNGVIAGDSSGAPTDTKQEEAAQQQSTAAMVQNLMDPAAADVGYYAAPVAEAEPTYAAANEAAMVAAPVVHPQPAPPAPTGPSDVLAAMMLADLNPPQVAPLSAPEAAPQPPIMETLQATSPAPAPLVVPEAPPSLSPPVAEPAIATPAAEEQKGILGAARRITNAVVQKLADYFEAKLPPSVLKEVQQIGVTMAAQGMREAPMPSGPEIAPVREQQIPGRGGDDQQIQRG